MRYFELPGVNVEPVVKMKYWRFLKMDFSESSVSEETVVVIYGEDEYSSRKSTPVISLEKHNGSDFEWIAITQSGRQYVLPIKGGKGFMGREMTLMNEDLYHGAVRNNIKLEELSVKECQEFINVLRG